MITAQIADASVAPTKKVPTHIFTEEELPWTKIDNEEINVLINNIAKPISAILRARLEEKSAISRMRNTGLTIHHGIEPAPPGFPMMARFGPPPESAIPGSLSKRSG